MLHAINHHKTGFYKRYLGHRDENEIRVQEEDEITSLIMSPLSFLPPKIIGNFWKRLVSIDNEHELPSGPVTKAEMIFWPRRHGIEPDMFVKLEWDTGEKWSLLVEFKWHAPLSENQLQKQWQIFLSDIERSHAYHIFIAPSLSCAINARMNNDVWEGKLLLRSWLQILNLINHFDSDPETFGLLPWSNQVSLVLQKFQIRPFIGFDKLLEGADLPFISNNWLFFQNFSGIKKMVPPKLQNINSNFFSI